MSLPPGPSAPTFVQTFRWVRAPFPFLEECQRRYGPTFTVSLTGLPRLVMFSEPEAVHEVFADGGERLQAGRFNRTLAALLGDRSVLMVDGQAHRRKRRLLVPPFVGERMQAYGRVMQAAADRAIDAWPLGKPFRFQEPMQDITLRVIVETVFGFREGPRAEEIREKMRVVLKLGVWPPLLLPMMQKDLGRLSPWGRFRRAVEAGDRLFYSEIAARRASGERGEDVLSVLLDVRDEDGAPMDDQELRDELVTLLVAGHETTATALSWALRWILDTPTLLPRLREELGGAGSDPESIAKLPLLDAVVRETLRLQPVVPLVGRVVSEPTRIGGFDLPADTAVSCSIYLAQRRPGVYPEPDRFRPERFLGKRFSPSELFPFGGGVRRCIGMAFALYEMKMVLARVLTRTELVLEEPLSVRPVRRSITLAPSRGLPVRMLAREPGASPS